MKKRIQRQDWQKKAAVGLRSGDGFLYARPHGRDYRRMA